MDIKTLLFNLHEEVSCSVCMNTFTDPKQLPCLHSFCLHCLKGIQRTSGRHDIITCPECRRETKVSEGGNLNELPTNFRINSLLDVLAIKECNTTGVKCGNCDKKSSQSFYCFQCCAFWCDDCIIGHDIMRSNKEHRVLALKDFQDEDIEDVLKRPAFCPQKHHEKEELKFFCKDCEVAICNSCVATVHDGHAKIILEEAANQRKLEVKSLIESQKKKAQQKRNKIAKIDESCIHIESQAAAVKRNVHRFTENLMAVIEANKKEILNTVDVRVKESLERLRTQQCEADNQVKVIETETEKTETLLKRSTSAEIARLHKSTFIMEKLQDEASDDEGQVDCDLEGLCRFIFVENEEIMEEAVTEGIGVFRILFNSTEVHESSVEGKGISDVTVGLQAEIVLTTRNTEGEQCYKECDCVTVEIRNQQGHDCATKAQVQDNKDGTYKISYFAKETGKCDVSVKVNGEHVRGSPFSVTVKSRDFMSATLCFECSDRPWGVAVNKHDEIAVTETELGTVQTFNRDGIQLKSFHGSNGISAGIAFDKNENIIVADSELHLVKTFDEWGEELSEFGEEGSLDFKLNSPRGLSVDRDGNIIVADSNNKLIKIFSPSGKALRKIGVDGLVTFPFHCVEFDQFLIVSDPGEHCIKVFDRVGNFLYKFGKKGTGDGEFNKPRCLSVNKAGHLMVCEAGNHRVQVFELSGKFITKFGTYGSGIGEFNVPMSTAVLSDGRIVVADRFNNRIQIFE